MVTGAASVARAEPGADDRPDRVALVVDDPRGIDDLDRLGVEQLEGHAGDVDRVAGHVAEGAGAEVEPAAPVERLVIGVVRPVVGRAEELVPADVVGDPGVSLGRPMPCGQIGRLVQTWISLIGPRMPDRISSTPARKPFSAVPWLPIWVQSFFSAASVRISRASSTDQVSGFWQKQCLPMRIAITLAGAWVWSGVLTVTASILSPISSSILR